MSSRLIVESTTISAAERGQDRVRVLPRRDGVVVALADGAGGFGDGAAAAGAAVDLACESVVHTPHDDPGAWHRLLIEVDQRVATIANPGWTTLVVAAVTGTSVRGVSAGDSVAWIVSGGGHRFDLTANQVRKPLVGAGAHPLAFAGELDRGDTLLLASDGLWKYASTRELLVLASEIEIPGAMDALVNLARLPSGALQDDVSLVLVRQSDER